MARTLYSLLTTDQYDKITLELCKAKSLTEVLYNTADDFDIDQPWFQNFTNTLAIVSDMIERARDMVCEAKTIPVEHK